MPNARHQRTRTAYSFVSRRVDNHDQQLLALTKAIEELRKFTADVHVDAAKTAGEIAARVELHQEQIRDLARLFESLRQHVIDNLKESKALLESLRPMRPHEQAPQLGQQGRPFITHPVRARLMHEIEAALMDAAYSPDVDQRAGSAEMIYERIAPLIADWFGARAWDVVTAACKWRGALDGDRYSVRDNSRLAEAVDSYLRTQAMPDVTRGL